MSNKKRGNFSIKNDILGGGLLTKTTISKHIGFVLYIFFLILAIITLSISVEDTQLRLRRNQEALKLYKEIHTSKTSRLLFLSKRDEVEQRLKDNGSKIEKPIHAPILIEDIK